MMKQFLTAIAANLPKKDRADITAELAAIVGASPLPRTEVTKKVWEYIKKHKLQDAVNKRMINADAKLKEIFKKAQVSMFEMTKLVSAHLK